MGGTHQWGGQGGKMQFVGGMMLFEGVQVGNPRGLGGTQ